MLDRCRERGIAYVPYFPLGSAFPGMPKVTDGPAVSTSPSGLAPRPPRSGWPGCSPTGDNILLIPGTSSVAHLEENVAAGAVTLSEDDLETLATVPSVKPPH